MLNLLPIDVLRYLLQYCWDDREFQIMRTCRIFWSVGKSSEDYLWLRKIYNLSRLLVFISEFLHCIPTISEEGGTEFIQTVMLCSRHSDALVKQEKEIYAQCCKIFTDQIEYGIIDRIQVDRDVEHGNQPTITILVEESRYREARIKQLSIYCQKAKRCYWQPAKKGDKPEGCRNNIDDTQIIQEFRSKVNAIRLDCGIRVRVGVSCGPNDPCMKLLMNGTGFFGQAELEEYILRSTLTVTLLQVQITDTPPESEDRFIQEFLMYRNYLKLQRASVFGSRKLSRTNSKKVYNDKIQNLKGRRRCSYSTCSKKMKSKSSDVNGSSDVYNNKKEDGSNLYFQLIMPHYPVTQYFEPVKPFKNDICSTKHFVRKVQKEIENLFPMIPGEEWYIKITANGKIAIKIVKMFIEWMTPTLKYHRIVIEQDKAASENEKTFPGNISYVYMLSLKNFFV